MPRPVLPLPVMPTMTRVRDEVAGVVEHGLVGEFAVPPDRICVRDRRSRALEGRRREPPCGDSAISVFQWSVFGRRLEIAEVD